MTHPLRPAVRWSFVANGALIAILLLATFLRCYGLDAAPPGLTHDEAAHLRDARRILEGARPVYWSTANGREPLYDYATAPLLGLLGMRGFAGRFGSAMWGVMLIALTYAWARRTLGLPAALGAALGLAVSFWAVSTSRQVLRSVTMPVLFAAAALCLWQGIQKALPAPQSTPQSTSRPTRNLQPAIFFAIAGALLGLSFYTYMPARLTWVLFLVPGVQLLFVDRVDWVDRADRAHWRRVWPGLVLALGVAALMAAPLAVYLWTHPGLEARVDELSAALLQAAAGDLAPLLQRAREALPMFGWHGDVHWMYNLSGRPLLGYPLDWLFYAGLVYALTRVRRPAYTFAALWAVVGVLPALLTGVESSSLRAIAAQPAVYILVALPVADLGRWLAGRGRRRAAVLLAVAFVALQTALGVDTLRTYFVRWAQHPDVRTAYHAAVAETARYLDARPEDGVVAISTLYPGPAHDPLALAFLLRRSDLSLRWFDARGALVLPEAPCRLLIPSITPLDPLLVPLVQPYAGSLDVLVMAPGDLVAQTAVYAWDAPAGRAATAGMPVGPAGTLPGDALPSPADYLPLTLPVDLGEGLALAGYTLYTPHVAPGGTVELLTLWRVHGPVPADLVLFAHVMDGDGRVRGQADRADAPAWAWQAGDLVAQVHRFSLDAAVQPGRYYLQVGAYAAADGVRLPVFDADGQPAGSRVLLAPVEVVLE